MYSKINVLNVFLFIKKPNSKIFITKTISKVDQVARKTFPWSIKAPWKSENFDQQISLDVDGDDTYRFTPHPIKARNPV